MIENVMDILAGGMFALGEFGYNVDFIIRVFVYVRYLFLYKPPSSLVKIPVFCGEVGRVILCCVRKRISSKDKTLQTRAREENRAYRGVVFRKQIIKVKVATAALIVVMLLFIIPAKDFLYWFSKVKSERAKTPFPALITWKVVQQKLPWGLIFLSGGGFALAEGSNVSEMRILIADSLGPLVKLPPFAVLVMASTFASILTEFSSNVAVANVLLPVLAEISLAAKWHPLYLMMPVALACSHAFCLPVGTPPNAIAAAPCNIPTKEMVKAGLGVSIISILVLFAIFPLLGPPVFGVNEFPEWAGNVTRG